MNLTFMAKLGWRLLQEKQNLWANILSGKYMRNHFTLPYPKFKSGASSIWNGILKALPLLTTVCGGLQEIELIFFSGWTVGLMTDLLMHILFMSSTLLTRISSWQTIGQMGLVGTGLLLNHFFPPTLLRIRAVMVHDESDLQDSWFWSLTVDGEFSVHTAYNHLISDLLLTQQCEWRQIWSLNVSTRVRATLWLIKHKKLMCNAERKRRGFTFVDFCTICSCGT